MNPSRRYAMGIASLFCTLSFAAPKPAPSLWVGRLLNPEVPLTSFRHSGPRPDETRRWGWVRVESRHMTESVSFGTPVLKGTHLEIGSILGRLNVGHLRGVLERTLYRPGYKRVYGVPVPVVRKVVHPTIFSVHNVGIHTVSKRRILIPLPHLLHLRVTEENGGLHYQIVNRRELEQYIERQVDLLLSDARAPHSFTFHLINRPTLLQPALDEAFKYFRSEMLAEMRRETKRRILESGLIDEILHRSRELVPPVSLEKGQSIHAFLTRDRRGAHRAWNLVLTSSDRLPPLALFRDWRFPASPRENQLQVGINGPGLVKLMNLALANTHTLRSSIPGFAFPPGVGVNARDRAVVVTPQTQAEFQATRSFFASLLPGEAIPENPVVEVAFPSPDARFTTNAAGVELELDVHLSLRGRNGQSTRSAPLTLWFSIDPDVKVQLTRLRLPFPQPQKVKSDIHNVLDRLGPGMQSLLLQAVINQKIEEAYEQLPAGTDLGAFLNVGPLNDNAGLSLTLTLPLVFPEPD